MTEVEFKSKAKKLLYQRIPFLEWIKEYTLEDAISDLIAGVTISLTIIPQSIAYASLANLNPKDGLNSAFMGCFIYVFFGTIKQVVIGPTSLMALLTLEYTHHLDSNMDFVVLLCFLSGIVELIMAVLRLGYLVDYISTPVVSGFTTATAIIVAFSQIKGILGIRFKAKSFNENLMMLHEKSSGSRMPDMILGISCIVILLVMRTFKDIRLPKKMKGKQVIERFFWFLSIGRNALVIICASFITYWYEYSGRDIPFLITGEVKGGLPPFKYPEISTSIGNQTYTFTEMVSELGSGIIVVPLVAVLANVAIAKAYADGGVKGNQEMLTLALCNVFGSFVQSMPTCGAFTRSAVINASGVRTPLAGLYSAGITLMALQFLAKHFHLIPRATLSAILIAAVIFLIDYKIILPLRKSSTRDFLNLVGTLIACLYFGVEKGLILGVAAGIFHLGYMWSKPSFNQKIVENEKSKYLLITPFMGLYFPSVQHMTKTLINLAEDNSGIPLILDCSNFAGIDYSSVKSLHTVSKSLGKHNSELIFLNPPEKLIKIWQNFKCGHMKTCTVDPSNEHNFLIVDDITDKSKSKEMLADKVGSGQETVDLLINDESKC